ncbi:alkaline phosphatase family protein [Halosolutus halophilus]|uniref:alkaline phosphatase family protein n=1 Tax=Halosolutus halophilus TaxID=1552990 RepID=UPI0022350F66|nr:alkaline phosphatase family protein [Halosolutus halophilus]
MSSADHNVSKTVIVGFDGMDWRYVDRFSDRLDNLSELRERGVGADLTSTYPPWTGSAWPSMYTGVTPDYHGVFDFFDYRDSYPDSAAAVTRSDVKAPALWDYLSDRELSSIVLNLPVTHPTGPMDGVLVPGYLAPADEPGYPDGIRDEIEDALGEPYRIYSECETASDTEKKVDGYVNLIEHRGAAAEYLLESADWELAIVQFQKTDAVFHNSTRTTDFERVYAAADRALGRILNLFGDETNVIVCSDHGMGPVDGYQIHINQILEDWGYLDSCSELNGAGGFKPVVEDESVANSGAGAVFDRLIAISSKAGLSPSDVHGLADRVGLAEPLVRVAPDWVTHGVARGVDWEASAAYCRSQSEQGIRLNVRGRDPSGVIDPDGYETVRSDLIDRLSSLQTPDGEPAFEFVKRREKVYDGPHTAGACDIFFRTNEMNHVIWPKIHGVQFHPITSFDHKRNGVFVAAGPDVDAAADVDRLSLTDIAPLAMTLLEQPVPERMTGSVPTELVTRSSSRTAYDTTVVDSSTYEQDQDDVRERLSDLGYL